MATKRISQPLARYTDRHGRRHRIVRRGALLLDLSAADMPRVIVQLAEGEGEQQVSPLVFGQGPEEGYLARMAREPGPICRALGPADVRCPSIDGADRDEPGPQERGDARRAA